MSKPYGLMLPNKSKLTPANVIKKPSIFEEESDSDEEVKKPTGISTTIKRQDRVLQEKAVEEDPTVYQYDEIYDQMEQEKVETKLTKKESDKKPKYINRLLAAAEKRKRENERRIERQVQKEREAEGDEFKDKESFVTSAYKKKLEELRKLEEEEKREEYLESIGDVTKQGNLDGFYRHLYDQKVNFAEKLDTEVKSIKEEPEIPPKLTDEDTEGGSEDTSKTNLKDPKVSSKKHVSQKRTYRKRESSESEDEKKEENDEKKLEHLPSNIDADSDFSIDSDSDESDDEVKSKKAKIEENVKVESKTGDDMKDGAIDKKNVKNEENEMDLKEKSKEVKEIKPKKAKIDIWKKRTVGAVFDEALQRYFERKALREAAK